MTTGTRIPFSLARRLGPRLAAGALALWALVDPSPLAAALDPSRQLADYVHETWTMAHGLPHEGITAVLQTRDGYLWVATLDGVARFDGVRFESFNLIPAAGTQTNVVLALAETPDGALWMGTRDGLVRYHEGRFTVITAADGLSSAAIRCLLADSDGSLWIGTRWGGLNHLSDGRITTLTSADGLAHTDVRSLARDPDGGLWVGTGGGLHFVRDGRVRPVPLSSEAPMPLVTAIHVDRQRTLWLGTSTRLLEAAAADRLDFSRPLPAAVRHLGTEVRALVEDAEGTLWVGFGEGLGRVRGARVELTGDPERLSYHHVRSLASDHEGSLWIGTDGGGLNRWRDSSIVLLTGRDVSMSLLAVWRAPDGAMWMGGNCGGVTRWKDGTTTRVTSAHGLPGDCVQSLAGEPSGAVWIGTTAGAARWQDGRITRVYTTANGLRHGHVPAIAIGRRGDVWLGTVDAGVVHIERDSLTYYDATNGLAHPDVRAIVESRDGTVWIGTFGGGLARWNAGVLTRLSRADGLSSDHILTLTEDADGTLWVGTSGGGLNRIRDGRITAYTPANGLPFDSVYRILDDERGALWVSSHRGIFSVPRQQLEDVAEGRLERLAPRWFRAPDGMPGGGALGGTQPAGDRDGAGRLWFPTLRGPAIIDPRHLVRNTVPPPVHVERVRVDGREAAGDTLLSLGPGVRDIEIDYTALSYAEPSKVRFRYRLEGFDEEWVDAGTRRTAYFTNLRPGVYTLHVVGSNNDGVWNDRGATVAFVLRPRFYQTWLFAAGCGLAALGVVVAGVHLRERRLRAHQAALARQVEQALAEVKVLSGLLPICASCRRIRDEQGHWESLEAYIQQHSQADFTHGICPECVERLYPNP